MGERAHSSSAAVRPLDPAQHLNLGLEQDVEALLDAGSPLGHQGEHVGGARLAGVLDEVGVLRGEAGSPATQAAATCRLEQLPRGSPPGLRASGFLKVDPNVLIPDGCASRRRPRISSRVARIASGSAGVSRNDARETTSPGPRFELR